MRVEYRIIFTMTFDNVVDRNNWYEKLKQVIATNKTGLPIYRQAHLTRDDYAVHDSTTEPV